MNDKILLSDLKTRSLKIYMNSNIVEGEEIELKYVNKEGLFDHYFSMLGKYLESWVKDIENGNELENLKKLPDYSFIHYVGSKTEPDNYSKEVGVFIVDEDFYERYKDRLSDEISFSDSYSELLCDTFGIYIDKKISKFVDKTTVLERFKKEPICEYENISNEFTEEVNQDLDKLQKLLLTSIGQAALNITKSLK